MKNLKKIIEGTSTKYGYKFDLFIEVLIIISLISFAFETLPNLSPLQAKILWIIEAVIVVIFTIEYILRLLVSDNKLKFIFSLSGIIDLLAIAPFYIAGLDLRSVRIFRLFKLFRYFGNRRYSQAITRYKEVFLLIRSELAIFLIATTFLLYLSGVGIYFFENSAQPEKISSIFDGLWLALITLTTVGYGDIYPITVGGKVFTGFILLLGLSIIAVPAGLIASALSHIKYKH
jgi:voltage-gated potassium channel